MGFNDRSVEFKCPTVPSFAHYSPINPEPEASSQRIICLIVNGSFLKWMSCACSLFRTDSGQCISVCDATILTLYTHTIPYLINNLFKHISVSLIIFHVAFFLLFWTGWIPSAAIWKGGTSHTRQSWERGQLQQGESRENAEKNAVARWEMQLNPLRLCCFRMFVGFLFLS